MRTTIDSAGRIVVPKAIRDDLGLSGGEEVEITRRDGRIEIEPVTVPMRVVRRDDGGVVIETDQEMPVLTVERVREVLERVRR